MCELPDGSGFFVGSFPLPKDHWLYAPSCAEWDDKRDTSADTPQPILDNSQREAVKAAIRWAGRDDERHRAGFRPGCAGAECGICTVRAVRACDAERWRNRR